jgi:hypothetical protein
VSDHLALFRLPIEGENTQNSMPVLILGVSPGDPDYVLTVDDDGRFAWESMFYVKTNWRWRDHRWVDAGEIDDTQDDAPDGGPDLSGSVPDVDRIGQGDPVNQEGRQTPGDPGSLDTGATQ